MGNFVKVAVHDGLIDMLLLAFARADVAHLDEYPSLGT